MARPRSIISTPLRLSKINPASSFDNASTSRGKGNVNIAWTRFDVYGSANPEHRSQIYFTRSTDQGQTFSMPFRISDTGGYCVDSDNSVEGAVPAVGPSGDVYIVWAGPLENGAISNSFRAARS